MKQVTQDQALSALQAVGIDSGDSLLVHSALQFLGKPVGGVGMYYHVLCEVLEGREAAIPRVTESPTGTQAVTLTRGTVAVPTFNFGFARGEPYDPERTPSVGMGSLSEFVRQLPGTLRTLHPMQSLAVFGRHAVDLAGRDTPSAFDPVSPFARMLELDFKLLLLGANVQAVSMIHYSEQRLPVPYRFWKSFSGPVARRVNNAVVWEEKTYRMFVRDLDIDPHLDLMPIQRALQTKGVWSTAPLNYGSLSSCSLVDFVAAADELLARDPWALVRNRPDSTNDQAF